MKLKEKHKKMLESYGRSFVVAALAAFQASGGDLGLDGVLVAGLIAVAGPALRALNPKDPAFGLVSTFVDSELKKLEKKVAVKKAPAKKKKSSGGGTPADHL
jgi:hypothetical protein